MTKQEQEEKRARRIELLNEARQQQLEIKIPKQYLDRSREELEENLQEINAQRDSLREQADHITRAIDRLNNQRQAEETLAGMSPEQVDSLVQLATIKAKGKQKDIK